MEFRWLLCFFVASCINALQKSHQCLVKDVPVMKNPKLDRLIGKWYSQTSSVLAEELKGYHIVDEVFIHVQDSPTSGHIIIGGRDPVSNTCTQHIQYFRQIEPATGKLEMTGYSPSKGNFAYQTSLVDTNYVGYLVAYRCIKENEDNTCNIPVLTTATRRKHMTKRDKKAIERLMNRLCIDHNSPIQNHHEEEVISCRCSQASTIITTSSNCTE